MSLIFSHSSFSKINDKRIYNNLYKGCKKTADPQLTSSEISSYCSCIADNVTEQLTVKELIAIELDLNSVKDKEEKLRIGLANKKVKSILSICLQKLYE
tara:strand:+ start:203 stop:499 length:297 start_codon:yes stop_codon:yes gene_type:complete